MWRRTPNGLSAARHAPPRARSVLASSRSSMLAIGSRASMVRNIVLISTQKMIDLQAFQEGTARPAVERRVGLPGSPRSTPDGAPRFPNFDDRSAADAAPKHWRNIGTQ